MLMHRLEKALRTNSGPNALLQRNWCNFVLAIVIIIHFCVELTLIYFEAVSFFVPGYTDDSVEVKKLKDAIADKSTLIEEAKIRIAEMKGR